MSKRIYIYITAIAFSLSLPQFVAAQTNPTFSLGWTLSSGVNWNNTLSNYYFTLTASLTQPPSPMSLSPTGTAAYQLEVYYNATPPSQGGKAPTATGSITLGWDNLASCKVTGLGPGASVSASGTSDSISANTSVSGMQKNSSSNTNNPPGIQTTVQGSTLTFTWNSTLNTWQAIVSLHTVNLAATADVSATQGTLRALAKPIRWAPMGSFLTASW